MVTTIELNFDSAPRAVEPKQPGCSGLHATQKTSVNFLNPEDKEYVRPVCVGKVSSISIGFTDPSEASSTPDSMTTAISEPDDLSNCEWIALANYDHDLQSFITDVPFHATVHPFSPQLASMLSLIPI